MIRTAPRVSVVIPTYNRRDDVARAVESARGQSLRDLEIVVVDDGSTDDTAAVLSAIDDPRLTVVRHEANRGISAARNTGVSAARAPVLAFLDSDDGWFPQKLDRQLGFMDARESPVCVAGVRIERGDGTKIEDRIPDPGGLGLRAVVERGDICMATVMAVDRRLFDAVGPFDEALPRLEDWDWLLRLARMRDVPVLPEVLSWHRAPVARDIDLATRAAARRVVERHGPELDRIDRALGRRLRAIARRHCAYGAWKSGRRGRAVLDAIRSVGADPVSGLRDLTRRLTT